MNEIKYLTMKEVAEKLKLTSTDAAIRWCQKKNLDMIKPLNKWIVPESALILALDEAMINQLKEKYGARWIDFYDAYKNNDLKRLDELKREINDKKYTATGFNHNELLNRINYGKS